MTDHATILLPAGRVAIFAHDATLVTTATALSQDWRFARVDLQVVAGDIESAISTYSQSASPELVIIETADISDAFIGRLGALAGVCAQGTDAVIIGPKNDVHLYRSLIGMGVRDYLVLPVREEDLSQIIARTLLDKRGLSESRLAVVMGAKGGVGATALAQSLAYLISAELGQKTLLADAAGSAGTLGIGFGLEGTTPLSEAIRLGQGGSDDDIRRLLQKSGDSLDLLLSGGEAQLTDHADADGFEKLLQRLMHKYPVAVFDASGSAHSVQKRMLTLASHITLVTTPTLPALRNTRALLSEIKLIRGNTNAVELVLNMKGLSAADEVPLADMRAALGLEPAETVTYIPKVFAQSEGSGQPAAALKSAGDLSQRLLPLARRMAGLGEGTVQAGTGREKIPGIFKKLMGK